MVMTKPNDELDLSLEGYEDRDYQRLGTKFLWNMRRAMLTDDPGLGKTPQAIKAAELPCMVVAPRYLTGQWEEAILREHGDAVIARADGVRYQRDRILNKAADWYIVNYEMLPTYKLPTGMRTFINDEAHHIRNRTATFSMAADALENADPTSRIYHLTATPFWKSVADVWMPIHVLHPDIFTSYHKFRKHYFNSLLSPWGGSQVVTVKPRMKADLKELMRTIMFGRTYKDVGRYLPSIIETTIKLRMPPIQRAIYQKLVDEYTLLWMDEDEQKKLIFQPTTVLHAMRQCTAHSGKFEAIKGILEDNRQGTSDGSKQVPAVVGFWYKDHARKMQQIIGDKDSVLITGDLDAIDRQRLAMQAQREGKHIVASERSLAEGVNLSAYRLFIWGEEHYVPGTNHQFMSRVVRDRNDNGLDKTPVRVFYVQVQNSIDVNIHRIATKRAVVNNATRELLQGTFGAR